ncbi:M1 family metallopeptidase [Acanthopleuribacter pedis]|uniref:M1 family metallopeptidase n=1 Tax=Acanthopleuribacter pedis TaxID=442870 RepID=A0A8J7QC50_9BACT|nr:M1 family metallopeptidase [Acanthopleuribacter pedis]MBO1321732.1 M1 family metallopeptidase [Acanthopleuribacter pedis]
MRRLELDVAVYPKRRAIVATALLHLNLGEHHLARTVLHLTQALKVKSVVADGEKVPFEHRDGLLHLLWPKPRRGLVRVAVTYRGSPPVAQRPPWQGGFVWAKDRKGRPWVSLACQIKGASMWLPVSGDFSDKIDTLELRVNVPKPLFCAANGRLVAVKDEDDGRKTYIWRHQYPIIPHNISINLADYRVEQRGFAALPDVPVILYTLMQRPAAMPDEAVYTRQRNLLFAELEKYVGFLSARYGPYPWQGEKLAVVHTPFLGMEHQTINAYGNGFQFDNGFDEILFHELGHEWFGNRVTAATPRDLWLQEGITTYITGLYLAEQFGPARAASFYEMQRAQVSGEVPLFPATMPTINEAFHNDIYTKAALVLRTLARIIGEPKLDAILYRWVNEPTLQQPGAASTAAFRALVAEETGLELGWFFDHYLRHAALPRLDVTREGSTVTLRWHHPDFNLPVPVQLPDEAGTRVLVPVNRGVGVLQRVPAGEMVVDPDQWLLRHEDDK